MTCVSKVKFSFLLIATRNSYYAAISEPENCGKNTVYKLCGVGNLTKWNQEGDKFLKFS